MKRITIKGLLWLPLILLLVGCSTERRSYSIAVHNGLSRPVTMWVVKDGPPTEAEWITPEQLAAIDPSSGDGPLPDVVIPPGKTQSTHEPMTGQFESSSRAALRIYLGTPGLTEMLSISRGSPARLDVPLLPGINAFILDDSSGPTVARRVNETEMPRGNATTKP